MAELIEHKFSKGNELSNRSYGPITRWTLAMFAGGSGDPSPIHIDTDFAKQFGFEDVFAHGMLSMAYMTRYLRTIVPQSDIHSVDVRFLNITPVGVNVCCSALVDEVVSIDGRKAARLNLTAEIDGGIKTLQGHAIVFIDREYKQ
ncbi:(3R)-hydroxyacyl-ACP dehydratase subunit HadB [Maricurvus nonylphenolicus]|uniref:MaoC/PaaZ C-terminal domain-containing protein n=1 Tax=Maricurvus nonylphenolicus TaxID=1008307 RepID=UPI0036F3472F